MRILMLTLHYEQIGGIEYCCRALSRELIEMGHEVEIWSMLETPARKYCQIKTRYLAPEKQWARSAYFRLRTPYLWQLLARKAGGFDLVLAMHVMAVPAIYWVSRLRRDLEYWVWVYGSEVWGDIAPVVARGLSRADRVIAVSDYTGKNLQRIVHDIERIATIYPPIDTRWFVPGPEIQRPMDQLTLLTVGRTDQHGVCYKGHDVVIRALRKIQDKTGRRVEYRIVGSGEKVGYLKKLAKEQGVYGSVSFIGNIDKSGLKREYQGCDLFIMPSRVERLPNGYITGEGFGIVYAEAAACGKPVVGSKHGGAAEAVLDGVTGILVDPTCVEDVAKAACAILEDPGRAAQMGRAGRDFVEKNFSIEVFGERIAALLEGV